MLWQLWCHCNPDRDKFSSTVVAVFPNVCLRRRSLCSNLVLTLKNCIEPPSYASTAYVVAIWPSFLFDSFVKIWDTRETFLGKWFTAPPGKKFPVRLCSSLLWTMSAMNQSSWPDSILDRFYIISMKFLMLRCRHLSHEMFLLARSKETAVFAGNLEICYKYNISTNMYVEFKGPRRDL